MTGLLKTVKDSDNRYRSSKMREGLVVWMGEMAGVIFVMTIDIVLGLNFLLCMSTLALFIRKVEASWRVYQRTVETEGEGFITPQDVNKRRKRKCKILIKKFYMTLSII